MHRKSLKKIPNKTSPKTNTHTTPLTRKKSISNRQRRRFFSTHGESDHSKAKKDHFRVEVKTRLLEASEDRDRLFTVFTAPWLAPVPFIDPASGDLAETIITADNTVKLPEVTEERSVLVQHAQTHFTNEKRLKSPTFTEFAIPNPGEGREEQLEARAERNFIQYSPGVPSAGPESDESFYLPIIRVGPTPFALMQLSYPSQRTCHLRMLGGKSLKKIHSSVESGTIAIDLLTNSLWGRALHNLTRPAYLEENTDVMRNLVDMNKIEERVENTGDLLRLMTVFDPTFANLRVNREYHEHNSVITARSPNIGKPRSKLYSDKIGPNTFGRVIATQTSTTPYPTDQPTYLHGDLKTFLEADIGVNYPRVGQKVPRKVSQNPVQNTSMVHLIDLGSLPIQGDGQGVLDPALLPNIKDQLIYPGLFNNLDATTELQSLATMLFSPASPQLHQVTKSVIQQHLERRYPGAYKDGATSFKEVALSEIIAPFSPSLAPAIAVTKALQKHESKPDATAEEMATQLGDENRKVKASGGEKTIFDLIFSPKYSQIESLDPRLLLWMLPVIYHWDKPGSIHPCAVGPIKDYHEFTQTERPGTFTQSASLHWVPLAELTNVDPYLAPRFNHNAELVTTTVDKQMNAQQHKEVLETKYAKTRPDLLQAHQEWSSYLTKLSRIERELLAKVSGSTVTATGINDQGQMLATSMGGIFPTRQSHLNLIQTADMQSFLNAIIKRSRQEAFEKIPGGEAKITKRFGKFPQMARHFGYKNDEISEFMDAAAAKKAKKV